MRLHRHNSPQPIKPKSHIEGMKQHQEHSIQEEWAHLGDELRDHTYDLADHWLAGSDELKTWWMIDKQLVGNQLVNIALIAADHTRTDQWLLDYELSHLH